MDQTPPLPTISTEVDLVTAAPDLVITANDAVSETRPGAVLTSTLSYQNEGNQNATGVFLTYSLPPGASFRSGTVLPGGSKVRPGFLTWRSVRSSPQRKRAGPFLASRSIARYAAGVDHLSSLASIRDDGANGTDPSPANNDATDGDRSMPRPISCSRSLMR